MYNKMKITKENIEDFVYKINPDNYKKYFDATTLDYDTNAKKYGKSVWLCIPFVDNDNKWRNCSPIECYVNDCECYAANYEYCQWFIKNIDELYDKFYKYKNKNSNYDYFSKYHKEIILFTKNKWIYEGYGNVVTSHVSFDKNEKYIAGEIDKTWDDVFSKGFAVFDNIKEAQKHIKNYREHSYETLIQIKQQIKDKEEEIDKLQIELNELYNKEMEYYDN